MALSHELRHTLLSNILLVILPTIIILFGCEYEVNNVIIQVTGTEEVVVLSELYGEKTSQIDSVTSSGNGIYRIPLNNFLHDGIYRLTFSNNRWMDFLYDESGIEIKTDTSFVLDNLEIIKSQSNQLYYSFIRLNKEYKTKTELLSIILTRYPKDDEYYTITQNKFSELQQQYSEFINTTSQNNPNSFIARYIKSSQLPIIDIDISREDKLNHLKSQGLDNIDFDDEELVYSDLFTNKTIEYLFYYQNPQLPKEILEKEFMKAVDSLLNRAKGNELVHQHIVEYLIDGFKRFGFDLVIDYIVKNYVITDNLCLDDETESSIQRRINQAKLLPINEVVPNIILPDTTGLEIDLSKINSEQILIVFYSILCPHCQKLLPELSTLYKNQKDKKIEIFAVSLDNNRNDWSDFINNNKFSKWINTIDIKGYDGLSASNYFVYATPTMFLVNKERRIMAKPISIDEAREITF